MTKKILVKIGELLTLFPSSLVVVYGPNGSGKTTLLKKIALSHVFPGENIQIEFPAAYLGHKFGTKLSQSVKDYLLFCLGAMDPAYLTRYSLKEDAKIGELSFGQIQKVGLIRILMSKEPIWILDEPLAHVDEVSKNLFLEDLNAYLASGGAAIIASHDTFPLPHESIYL